MTVLSVCNSVTTRENEHLDERVITSENVHEVIFSDGVDLLVLESAKSATNHVETIEVSAVVEDASKEIDVEHPLEADGKASLISNSLVKSLFGTGVAAVACLALYFSGGESATKSVEAESTGTASVAVFTDPDRVVAPLLLLKEEVGSNIRLSEPLDLMVAREPIGEEMILAANFESPNLIPSQSTASIENAQDWRIEKALNKMQDGDLIAPAGENAIAYLTSLLADQPDHPRAIELLNDCTLMLMDEAKFFYLAGKSFQARNILEEVLAFNSQHEGAKALWQTWKAEGWRGHQS